jgi:hypothetical protein
MPIFHLCGNEGSGGVRIEAVDGGTEHRLIADSWSALRFLFAALGQSGESNAPTFSPFYLRLNRRLSMDNCRASSIRSSKQFETASLTSTWLGLVSKAVVVNKPKAA